MRTFLSALLDPAAAGSKHTMGAFYSVIHTHCVVQPPPPRGGHSHMPIYFQRERGKKLLTSATVKDGQDDGRGRMERQIKCPQRPKGWTHGSTISPLFLPSYRRIPVQLQGLSGKQYPLSLSPRPHNPSWNLFNKLS